MSDELGIQLVERWRNGDEEAVNLLYQRYVERMVRIVCGQLKGTAIAARLDPEDVVQSAFFSVFRRMRGGEFQFQNDDELWKLLVTIALNKTRSQVTKNLAARRSINRETKGDCFAIDESIIRRVQMQPCISDVLAFRETLDNILKGLAKDDAQVVQLRLEGYTQEEIAEKLKITDRTVRRKLAAIREKVSQDAIGDPGQED